MRKNIAILTIGVSVSIASIALAVETTLTEETYDQTFVGNTMLGGTKSKPWKLFEKADGKRVFNMANGFFDQGKRWFNDKGELCAQWQKVGGGKKFCSTMRKDGDFVRWIGRDGKEKQAKVYKGKHVGWDYSDWE